MSQSNRTPPDDTMADGTFAKSNADLERAIERIANPVAFAEPRSAGIPYLQIANSLMCLALTVLVAISFRHIHATKSAVDKIDVDAINQSASDVVDAMHELRKLPTDLQKLEEPDKLGWLRQLPNSVDEAKRKMQDELLPAIDGEQGIRKRIDDALRELQSLNEKQVPELRKQVDEFEKLLTDVGANESEAGVRLTTTLREVRESLTHLRFLTSGDKRKVRVAIVRRSLKPRVLAELIPQESDWKRFQMSHPDWSIQTGIIVEGKYQSLSSYGNLDQGDVADVVKYQPDSGFRHVLIVESESPVPKSLDNATQIDALVVVNKNTPLNNDGWKQYLAWCDFCRKTNGETKLLACDFEGEAAEMRPTDDSKKASRLALYRLASPQWPLLGSSAPTKGSAQ